MLIGTLISNRKNFGDCSLLTPLQNCKFAKLQFPAPLACPSQACLHLDWRCSQEQLRSPALPRPLAPDPASWGGGSLCGRGQLVEPRRDWRCPRNRAVAKVHRSQRIRTAGILSRQSADPSASGIAALSTNRMRSSPVLSGQTAP